MALKNKIKIYKTPIIAGKYKGKKIAIPAIDTTRSSKAILRESLFNTIAYDIVDCNFVEMFAGSGSVGLEAISRGAYKSYFLEQNPAVYRLLKENINHIDSQKAYAMQGDAFSLFEPLYSQLKAENRATFFYFDPPFNIREGMEDIYEKTINIISKIQDNFVQMVIVEHISSIDLPKTVGRLIKYRTRKFGKSSLSYYRFED